MPKYTKQIAYLVVVMALTASATADLTRQYSQGNLAALATFAKDGTNLIITLENVSIFDVTVPEEVLTGVFFDLDGVTLTPVRAVLTTGSHVLFPVTGDGVDSNGEVGGEYAFRDDLTCGPSNMVIASVGLDDTLGPKHLFPGERLWSPDSPDGLGYGIVSAGYGSDPDAERNEKVSGAVPLVKNGVVFTLSMSGLPEAYELEGNLSNIEFNYGTEFSPTPVPGAVVLGAIGLGIVGLLERRIRRVRS